MRRLTIGLVIGALVVSAAAPAVAAEYPGKDDVVITTAKVDRAGNAIIDFELSCDVAMRADWWGVRVDQYSRKGAHAWGSVQPVQWGYFCMPGAPMSPHDGDQFVENGALFIRPGWSGTEGPEASAPFGPGYATISVNIGWTGCPGATDWESCDAYIELNPDAPVDAFWSYQTVKLVRSR